MLPLRKPAAKTSEESRSKENSLRVTFGRGYDVGIAGIDGT
jgi:hypothetical protein